LGIQVFYLFVDALLCFLVIACVWFDVFFVWAKGAVFLHKRIWIRFDSLPLRSVKHNLESTRVVKISDPIQ